MKKVIRLARRKGGTFSDYRGADDERAQGRNEKLPLLLAPEKKRGNYMSGRKRLPEEKDPYSLIQLLPKRKRARTERKNGALETGGYCSKGSLSPSKLMGSSGDEEKEAEV